MPRALIDTNILVYAAEKGKPVHRKVKIAREVLLQQDFCLSVQVLSEFTANARSEKKLDLSREEEKAWVQRFLLFPIQTLTVDTYIGAQLLHEQSQISHWDAMILTSAKEAGCSIVYSEDLQDGQVYAGVKVINPFL